MDKRDIESIVRQVLSEVISNDSDCGVRSVSLTQVQVTATDRLDTGVKTDQVYTHDLFTLQESRNLGCGIMEMTNTTFPWHLDYDEIDYVISGQLTILCGGKSVSAQAGEVIFIPKGSDIQFSVHGHARFLYVTYPADWQSEKK